METIQAQYKELLPLYWDLGWSLIPVKYKNKTPDGSWSIYQKERADADTISEWFLNGVTRNIAVVCGKVSGVVCLDVDGEEGKRFLQEQKEKGNSLTKTIVAKSSRGFKYFYKYPKNVSAELSTRPGIVPQIDFISNAHYVLLPPSVHPDGSFYTWVKGFSPANIQLAEMPEWILNLVTNFNRSVVTGESGNREKAVSDLNSQNRDGWVCETLSKAILSGNRNATLTRLCGRWCGKQLIGWEVTALMSVANKTLCKPPVSDWELQNIVRSVTNRHSRAKLSLVEKLHNTIAK